MQLQDVFVVFPVFLLSLFEFSSFKAQFRITAYNDGNRPDGRNGAEEEMRITRFIVLVLTPLLLGGTERGLLAGTLNNVLTIPGDSTDLFSHGSGLNGNRLGGFGSDLFYHRGEDLYYGLVDRGPSGGLESRVPRMQQFSLQTDPATGKISDFQLQRTIPFKTSDGSEFYDVMNPVLLNGSSSQLGRSFDPEGLAIGANGNYYVADEYGPSLYEFAPFDVDGALEARFVRSFEIPDNLIPVDSRGQVNYVAERETNPELETGRQDNRGFEGLAMSPDGSTLFAALQAPLAEEGDREQGRRSGNVRLIEFDLALGQSTAQYIYQLENVDQINRRVDHDFESKHQGRRIGVGAVRAVNDHELLIMERDNRGIGVENPVNADPEASDVGTKRIYRIDLAGATDVSNVSLRGDSDLPSTIIPVAKSLVLDVHETLQAVSLTTPEKTEGLAIGPQLADGKFSLIVATDNDSSALLLDSGEMVDVYTDGTTGLVDEDLQGRTRLPSLIYAFAVDLPNYEPPMSMRPLKAGDADQDLDFDQLDLVQVQIAGKYLTDQPATWGEGDWNGAPGGSPGNPPSGDGRFDQLDIVAALQSDVYLTGPYATASSLSGVTLLDDATSGGGPIEMGIGERLGVTSSVRFQAVPEPNAGSLALIAIGILLRRCAIRSRFRGSRHLSRLTFPIANRQTLHF